MKTFISFSFFNQTQLLTTSYVYLDMTSPLAFLGLIFCNYQVKNYNSLFSRVTLAAFIYAQMQKVDFSAGEVVPTENIF